ncbi:hypothetical protein BGW38_003945, partial [Lunasporangiospora selenospora]
EVKEITFSFTLVALLFATGAAYASYRATRRPSRSLTGFVSQSGHESASTQVNQFIKWYINATWIAILGYLFFDVGKIWAVVGALHNLLEVALLIVLQSGGRVSSLYFGLYMFVYVCVTIILSVYLSWPMDAIFFRWQGLCSDFGLVVFFIRMYCSTKKQLDQYESGASHDQQLALAQVEADRLEMDHHLASSSSFHSVNLAGANGQANGHANGHANGQANGQANGSSSQPHTLQQIHTGFKKFVARAPRIPGLHDSSSESDSDNEGRNPNASLSPPRQSRPRQDRPVVIPIAQNGHGVADGNGTANAHGSPERTLTIVELNQDPDIWGVEWHNPNQIRLLIAAAIFHVLGNCVTTIWAMSTAAMAAFHISYGLSFPLYAYYLYVDNHALRQTKIYLPDCSKFKTITGVCLSLIGATATVRAGLFVATRAAAEENGMVGFGFF